MKRNKNIDIVRAIAILMVLIYHIYAITNIKFNIPILDTFLVYGGMVGVSIFFVLSGYGIYISLRNQEQKEKKETYREYLIKRLKRLAPQYYFSLIILLLFTGNAVYLAKDQIFTLITHLFFFHSNYYRASGAISGVCWTLGIIFQFYLIAPLLYKAIQKKPKLTLVISLLLSVIIKVFLYHYVFNVSNAEYLYYANYGRQVYTAIDHFVIGMFVAKISFNQKDKKASNILNLIMTVILLIGMYFILDINTMSNLPIKNTGINSDCIYGYLGYTFIAVIIGLIVYFVGRLTFKLNSLFSRFLLFISKYEYGIYIWHLVIITTLTQASPVVQNLVSANNIIAVHSIFIVISIIVGYLMTIIIDGFDYENWFNKNKKVFFITIKVIALLLALLCIFNTIKVIKPIISNFKNYINADVVDYNESKKIAEHFDSLVKEKEGKKYAYIDKESTGYLYFFQLRYYLSPCESVHYSEYAYLINYIDDINQIYEYLISLDLDYIIIKENDLLSEYLSLEFDSVKGSIFKINKDSTNIKDYLIEMEGEK